MQATECNAVENMKGKKKADFFFKSHLTAKTYKEKWEDGNWWVCWYGSGATEASAEACSVVTSSEVCAAENQHSEEDKIDFSTRHMKNVSQVIHGKNIHY